MTIVSLLVVLIHFYMCLVSFCVLRDLALKIIAFSLESYEAKCFRIAMKLMKGYLTTSKNHNVLL